MPQPCALAKAVLDIAGQAGVAPVAEASPNLLVVPREGKAGEGWVVVELQRQSGSLTLPRPATDLLTRRKLSGKIEIPPYGVMVLKF
jgi:beta-galactosidase GanA